MINKIQAGNFAQESQSHHGWVVGHFLAESSPLKTSDVEFKWSYSSKGDIQTSLASNKNAKSVCILIRGQIEFEFPDQKVMLSKEGDYVFWDKQVPHRWKILEDSLSLVLRWPSLPNDQTTSKY